MAKNTDYKRRKKRGEDIGNPQRRQAAMKAEREAYKAQQEQAIAPQKAKSPYIPFVPLVAEGSADRRVTTVNGKPFWESQEFDQFATKIVTGGYRGKDNAASSTIKKATVSTKVQPSPAPPELDKNLKPGQRLYYNPKDNKITYRENTYLLSEKGETAVNDGLVPIYEDDKGELTITRTNKAALYPEIPEVSKASMVAAEKLNYPKKKPAALSTFLISKGSKIGYGVKASEEAKKLFEEANVPLVPVGYTKDEQPFYFDGRASVKEMMDQVDSIPDLTWIQRKGLKGALAIQYYLYEPIQAFQITTMSVKEFIESPAVQSTTIGRGVDSVLAKATTLVSAAKTGLMYLNYISKYFNYPVIPSPDPQRQQENLIRFAQLKNDAAQRLSEAEMETRRLIEMQEDLNRYMYGNTDIDPEHPWMTGLSLLKVDENGNLVPDNDRIVSEGGLKYIKQLMDNAPQAEQERNQLYKEAFNSAYSGDLDIAYTKIKMAVDADVRANPWSNPYMSYSFRQEPERYDAFLEDLAILTVQKGSPLDYDQILELKRRHENFWVELGGESILDLLNIKAVDLVMESVVTATKKGLGTTLRGLGKVTDETVGKIPLGRANTMSDVFHYFGRHTTRSTATKVSNTIFKTLEGMKNAAGSNEEFKVAMRDVVLPALQKADNAGSADELIRIFEEARAADKSGIFGNMSIDQFKKLTDAYSTVSGNAAIVAAEKSVRTEKKILTGDEWSKFLNDALDNYSTDAARRAAERIPGYFDRSPSEQAAIVAELVKKYANTPKYANGGIAHFADEIGRAYVDYHRISTKSRLLDDSIAGKIVMGLKDLAKKDTTLAKIIGGDKLIPTVEWFLERSAFMRDVWTMAVLSLRPAWIVQNFVDSLFRSVIDGGSVWDNAATLFFSTQAHLAGEMGVGIPIELGQSLTRNGLDFFDSVQSRILYEGWRPNWGIFSYWNFERQRLAKEGAAATDLAMRSMPEGWRKSVATVSNWFKNDIWTGVRAIPGGMQDLNTSIEFTLRLRMFNREYFRMLKVLEPSFTGKLMEEIPDNLKSIAAQIWRISDNNPAKVKAYINSLDGVMEGGRAYWSFNVPPDIQKSVIGLTTSDQEAFITTTRMQLDNLVESILKSGRTPEPEDFKKFFGELVGQYRTAVEERMSDAMRLRQLQNQIPTDKAVSEIPDPAYVGRVYTGQKVADDVYGTGTLYTTSDEYAKKLAEKNLTAVGGGEVRLNTPFIVDDVEKVRSLGKDAYDATLKSTKSKTQAREAATKAIRENLQGRGFDGVVIRDKDGTEKVIAFFPKKQFQSDLQVRRQVVNEAVKNLKVRKVNNTGEFIDDYSEVMRGVAEVERVENDATVKVVYEQGRVRILVGDKVSKSTLKSRLSDATMEAMYRRDEGYIRAKNYFVNSLDYMSRFKRFANNPTELLTDNPQQFRFFAQQMNDNPTVRAAIETLRGKRMRFEELDKLWEKYGRTIGAAELYTAEGKAAFFRKYNEMLDEIHMAPAEFGAAGDTSRDASIRLGGLIDNHELPTGIVNDTRDLMGKLNMWDERLSAFYRDAFPGPRRVPGGQDPRPELWDVYYELRTESYKAEAVVKDSVSELLESGDLEGAKSLLDDWNANFIDNFLESRGVKYELADDGINMYSITVPYMGRELKAMDSFSMNHFIASFLSPEINPAEFAVPIRMRRIIPDEFNSNLYEAVYRTMGLPGDEADAVIKVITDRADKWSSLTNRPIVEYLHRAGIRADGFEEGLFNSYISLLPEEVLGRMLPYGLGAAGEDAVTSMSIDAARTFLEDLRSASQYSKEAARYFRNVEEYIAEDGSIAYGEFAMDFMDYVNSGKFGHKGKSKLYEYFKSHLADTYRSVMDTALESRLDPAVNEFLGRITRDVDLMPHKEAEVHMLRSIAKDMGLPVRRKDMLKTINEDVKEITDVAWKETLNQRRAGIQERLARYVQEQASLPDAVQRGRTIADELAQQGRISQVVAEYAGRTPKYGDVWDEPFLERITREIEELPDELKTLLDEGLMDGLEGKSDGLHLVYSKTPLDYNLIAAEDGRLVFASQEEADAYLEKSVAFAMGRGKNFKHKMIVYPPGYIHKPNSLAHEMYHFFYEDMKANPAAKQVIDGTLDKIRQETRNITDKVFNPSWIEENLVNRSDEEVAKVIRDTYKRLHTQYGYVPYSVGNLDKITDAQIKEGLRSEINILVNDVDALIKNPELADEVRRLYLGVKDTRSMPYISMYFGAPNGQFFGLTVFDDLAKRLHLDIKDFQIDEELVTYSLERFGIKSNQFDIFSPIIDAFLGKEKPRFYQELYDVPLEYGRDALWRQGNKLKEVPLKKPPVGVLEEMQAAWDVWSVARDFRAFGKEEDRSTVMAFRDYLRRQMLGNDPNSEIYATYRQLMWQVEQFEQTVTRFHKGDALMEALTPVIPEGMIDDGVRTWIRSNEYSLKTLEAAERTLKDWERFMIAKASGKDPTLLRFTSEEMAALRAWGEKATTAKADLVSAIINGGTVDGKNVTGAVDKVNHIMLDYQTRNNFDQMMSNFFPFWMFPSRSWPFWVETMAMHPKLISLYMKVKRASQSARYQAGAVNSRGEPLPSLEGYLPIQFPGMAEPAWVNPLAPFSFRYVLDPMNLKDDIQYALQSEETDMPPMTFLVKNILEGSSVFGFYAAPWINWGLKSYFDIPDYVLPQFPVFPQIQLIPRWRVPNLIHLGSKLTIDRDSWYPEVTWHDYLVERDLLREANQKIGTDNMTEAQRIEYVKSVETAIRDKGDNPIWLEAYKKYTEDEAKRSQLAYFTGIYTKEFSDSDADFYALRNERNLLKSALQNKMQMKIFFDETDQDYALYDKYLNARKTPEGYLYQIYSDLGWITNEAGMLVRDPQERATLLALKIDQRRNNDAYYDALAMAQNKRDEALRALKIGAPWEQVQKIYDEYGNAVARAEIQYDPSFSYYGSSKSPGRIQDDVTARWYDYLWTTRPRWNPEVYETYKDYEARVAKWEKDLPNIAKTTFRFFQRDDSYYDKITRNLKDTQRLPEGFMSSLAQSTTADVIYEWRKQNRDDIFDALNTAWDKLYWNPYWDTVENYKSYERAYVESKFLEEHPYPPTAKELYAWIQENYGDKFTLEEVTKWVDGNNKVMSYEQRLESTQNEAEKIKDDIWNILSWVEPGGAVRDQFEEQIIRNGVDRDFFTKWYNDVYQDENQLKLIRKAVFNAAITLELKAPSRAQLAEWAVAQNLNDDFSQIKKTDLPSNFESEYNYYNVLEYKEKKAYKKDYPDNWKMIQKYYDMRDAYAQANPVWAKYYNPYMFEKMQKKGMTMTQTVPSDSPVPANAVKGTAWPSGMKSAISPILVGNVEKALAGGKLSQYDISYLEQIANTHPAWREFIAEVIAKGE